MTVEEPKTSDAESATTNPGASGTEPGTQSPEATPPEAAAEAAPAETAQEDGAVDAPAQDTAAEASQEVPSQEPAAEVATAPGVAEAEAPEAEVASPQEAGAESATGGAGEAMNEPRDEAAVQEATREEVAASQADSEAEQASGAPAGATDEQAPLGAGAAMGAPSDGSSSEQEPTAEAPAPRTATTAVATDQPEPSTMEELLAEQSGDIPSLKHGDVVEGTIVRIDKDEMLVDVGAKSEGVVSNRELYGRNTETQPDLNVGDTVLVYVLQPESADGHAVLSLRRAGLERKWRSMQDQFDEGVIIEAPVIDHNKGGLIVDCGIRGFVPISQIVDFPRRPQNDQPRDAAQEIAEKLQPYVGRKLRLKILEVNRKANRLILSEKVALYEERREKRDELFSSLQVGEKVKGTVRSIAPFGIFIDLGGIDGLVHKSELSWNKVNNPEGAYEVGDEVEAEVIDINHERGRISLSIRRLLPDPWQSTVADLKVGDIVDGTVTKIVNFGAFVRVKDGLEGLIHISELSHQRVAHPGDVVHEGQTLKLKVISLDSERHRLGLSLKQAEEAPARPARERRARPERGGYDRSQAIQEPEGGIDNTLAAAFAQVRQQIAEQDATGEAEAPGPEAEAAQAQPAPGEGPAAVEQAPAMDESTAAQAGAPAEEPASPEAGAATDGPVAAEEPASADEAAATAEPDAASAALASDEDDVAERTAAETTAAEGETSAAIGVEESEGQTADDEDRSTDEPSA